MTGETGATGKVGPTRNPMAMGREVLFDGAHLRAEPIRPDAEILFVRFDNLRLERNGFPQWSPSQRVAALGMAELSIMSAQNDWFLNPDLGPLRAALRQVTGRYRTVRCLAFSMGGYGALLLSRALRLRHAVLVSPQFCGFADQPPGDHRYRRFAGLMDSKLGDLTAVTVRKLHGVVLFDPVGHPMDRAQARLILAQAPNMRAVAMTLGGHPATLAMMGTEAAQILQDHAYAGRAGPALYRALHVAARVVSPLYQQRLGEALVKRASRPRAGCAPTSSPD